MSAQPSFHAPAPHPRCLVRAVARPHAQVMLVCLPHAGGGPSFYHPWMCSAPGWVEVAGINYPGRERRIDEPPARRVESLVDEILAAVAGLDRELALFGHSMGALVAYELARRLEEGGRSLRRLFVSGYPAPHLSCPVPPRLADHETNELVAALRRLGGMPQELDDHDELLELVMPALCADLEACSTYPSDRERAPLVADITVLGGSTDTLVSHAELAAWRHATAGSFSLERFPGGHFYLKESASAVLDTVTSALASGSGTEL